MKFSVVILLGLLVGACSFGQPVAQETYFVPVIQSDVPGSGKTPSVVPVVKKQSEEVPLVYPSSIN